MTVKIRNDTYRNVAKIDDNQTKDITIRLMFPGGSILAMPVTENDEVIFTLEDARGYVREKK